VDGRFSMEIHVGKNLKIPWRLMEFYVEYSMELPWNTAGLHGVFICFCPSGIAIENIFR